MIHLIININICYLPWLNARTILENYKGALAITRLYFFRDCLWLILEKKNLLHLKTITFEYDLARYNSVVRACDRCAMKVMTSLPVWDSDFVVSTRARHFMPESLFARKWLKKKCIEMFMLKIQRVIWFPHHENVLWRGSLLIYGSMDRVPTWSSPITPAITAR